MRYSSTVPAEWSLPVAIGDTLGRGVLVVGFMMLVFAVLVFQFLKVRQLYGGGDGPDPETLSNCPSCGARISAAAETCTYCGDSVDR
jgi:hypothetical protein